MFANKTLLITGGTGTFGNAVLQRFLDTDIAEIRVFSRDELKQHELRLALGESGYKVARLLQLAVYCQWYATVDEALSGGV